jgi:exodeoxyribonuclease-3
VIFCGDVNTAHKEIDLARPKENAGNSGFMPIERAWLDKITAMGWVDTFRTLHPEPGQYTWWDYKPRARERNVGWRLDYFFINKEKAGLVGDAFILPGVQGSDHCPAGIVLDL